MKLAHEVVGHRYAADRHLLTGIPVVAQLGESNVSSPSSVWMAAPDHGYRRLSIPLRKRSNRHEVNAICALEGPTHSAYWTPAMDLAAFAR